MGLSKLSSQVYIQAESEQGDWTQNEFNDKINNQGYFQVKDTGVNISHGHETPWGLDNMETRRILSGEKN